jgi:hypothetical protein
LSGYATYQDLTAGIVLVSIEDTKVTQPDIWIGTIEISWSDEKTPTVFQPAFTVVTTWATSREEFREKCVRMLESYGWKLLDVEQANPVPNEAEFTEDVEDMLERTRTNPNAIIYGTFHSYPVM